MKTIEKHALATVFLIATLTTFDAFSSEKDDNPGFPESDLRANPEIAELLWNMIRLPGNDFGNCKIGRECVTSKQWHAVMEPDDEDSREPITAFLEKLNAMPVVKKFGMHFRLPTVEEWERACLCKTSTGIIVRNTSVFEDLGGWEWTQSTNGVRRVLCGGARQSPLTHGLAFPDESIGSLRLFAVIPDEIISEKTDDGL